MPLTEWIEAPYEIILKDMNIAMGKIDRKNVKKMYIKVMGKPLH